MNKRVNNKRILPKVVGYVTTLNRAGAERFGYIGEVLVLPNVLSSCIKSILGVRVPVPFIFYYCGIPDERLIEKFGLKRRVNPNGQS